MSIIIPILVALLFLVGLAGTIIPALPGVGLVYAGVLLYAFVDGFAHIGVANVLWLGLVALLALGAQYAGSMWGAAKGGGKKKALAGTFIGAFVGAFMGPVGIFIGAFVGALAGAMMEGSSTEKAMKVAGLSVVGIIGGSLIQFLLSVVLIFVFLIVVIF